MKGATRHILIVDDNATIRKLLAEILQADGYTTSEASDGAEALELLEKTTVDAIVSDILMPNMDGYMFCFEVRRSRKHSTLPFIFLTATYTSPSDEKQALDLGADRILKKPLSSTEILNALREMFSNTLYQKPRAIVPIREIEVIKQYTDGLVIKLEEKIIELHEQTEELKKLSSALEQTADSVAITNKEGVIEYVNRAFEQNTGYKKEIAIGKTPAILKSGKHDAAFYEKLWKTILSGKVFREEFVNRKSNGEFFYEQQTISPVLDNDGKVVHFVSTGRDITEHKHAEERLRLAHAQLKQLLDHSPAVIFRLKIEHGRIHPYAVSENITRLLGFTVEESKSFEWWAAHLHPGDKDRAFASIEETLQRGTLTCEYRLRHKNGEYVWVEDTRRVLRDPTGWSEEIIGVWTDITERKEAEEKLQESMEQFRLIAENVADLIAVLDVNGKRLYNSPSYKNILGDTHDLLGTDSFEEIHPDDRERIRNVFSDTLQTGIGQRTEFRFLTKDGSVRHIESLGSVIRDEEGNPTRVVIVSRDITEKKSLEEQFHQAQKLETVGTLAGGIAHDFNNILGIILGHITLLKRQATDSNALKKSSEAIEEAVQRGAGLVRQILTLASRTPLTLASVNVNTEIESLVKLLGQTFPKTLEVSIDLHRSLPVILIDQTQFRQALLNICINARDAIMDSENQKSANKLHIQTSLVDGNALRGKFSEVKDSSYVRIAVSDNGMGMTEATKQKIFEPFFTTKEKGKGTGLGLAVVYGVIRTHHGFIGVESEPGKGTTFEMFFPETKHMVTHYIETDPLEDVEIPAGDETILLVEDEESLRTIMKRTLEDSGYTVLTAGDGIEAIHAYTDKKEQIDMVLSDMGLPKLDGSGMFSALKAINPQIKVVFITGYVQMDVREELLNAGVKYFFEKPFLIETVVKKIRSILDEK